MIEKISSENPLAKSAKIIPENIARLAELFPDAFADGKVNVQKLLENIGVFAENEEEKFGLNWSGKQKAKQIALAPTNKTLRPNKDESKNWDTTENLYIEGDNLEVLKLLQKAYAGQIKMIYIDPPYNTGKDFVYSDKFAMANKDALVREGLVDDEGSKIKSTDVYDINTKNSARYHTNWLNMMYPRLRLARNLLKDDGVIFVSIDDTEVANLRKVCDEVFGEENMLAELIWKSGRTAASHFTNEHEYILSYGKNISLVPLFEFNGIGDVSITDRAIKRQSEKNPVSIIRFPAGIDFESDDQIFPNQFGDAESVRIVSGVFECKNRKLANSVEVEAAWAMKDMIEKWLEGDDVVDQKGQKVCRFFFKSNGVLQYEKERGTIHPKSILEGPSTKAGSNEIKAIFDNALFSFPKPVNLVKSLVELVCKKNQIVLDFFSGSATTAHAVMQLNAEDQGNRKFILAQIPEACAEDSEAAKAGYVNICEIGKERIRRAGEKIKSEGADKEGIENLDIGFRVFKLDTSNIKEWNTETDDLLRDLFNHQDHLNETRNEEDILFELMLKLNRPLTAPIETKKIAKQTVFCVDGGALMVCLPKAKALTSENVEALSEGIIKWHQETGYISGTNNQAHFVFRDTAFADDVAKANLSAIFEQAGYNNLRSL